MLPPHQCLDAQDVVGAQVDDRLVLEPKLTRSDGNSEIRFERGAVEHVVVHLGVEELVATLAGPFGHVHGEVGVPEQLRSVFGPGVALGHPDAHRDGETGSVDDERLAQ